MISDSKHVRRSIFNSLILAELLLPDKSPATNGLHSTARHSTTSKMKMSSVIIFAIHKILSNIKFCIQTVCSFVRSQVPLFNGSSYLRFAPLGDTALIWLELKVIFVNLHFTCTTYTHSLGKRVMLYCSLSLCICVCMCQHKMGLLP